MRFTAIGASQELNLTQLFPGGFAGILQRACAAAINPSVSSSLSFSPDCPGRVTITTRFGGILGLITALRPDPARERTEAGSEHLCTLEEVRPTAHAKRKMMAVAAREPPVENRSFVTS